MSGPFKLKSGNNPDKKGFFGTVIQNIKNVFKTKQYPGGYSKQKKYQERGQSRSSKHKRKTQ